jgi:hypothetical protein
MNQKFEDRAYRPGLKQSAPTIIEYIVNSRVDWLSLVLARGGDSHKAVEQRYPRLVALLREVCILTHTEASSALLMLKDGETEGGAEAVARIGGPLKAVAHALRFRHRVRRTEWYRSAFAPRLSFMVDARDKVAQRIVSSSDIEGPSDGRFFRIQAFSAREAIEAGVAMREALRDSPRSA